MSRRLRADPRDVAPSDLLDRRCPDDRDWRILDAEIDAALGAGDDEAALKGAREAAELAMQFGTPSGLEKRMKFNYAVSAAFGHFAKPKRQIDAADRDYQAALLGRREIGYELEDLEEERLNLYQRAVVDGDLYAQYELDDVDQRIAQLKTLLQRQDAEICRHETLWINAVEELEAKNYLLMRKHALSTPPPRSICGTRHRRASRPAAVRRRGSRRATATRAGPSSADDPHEPPGDVAHLDRALSAARGGGWSV